MYLILLGNSAGAPDQTSGAPSETTCGRSGCHAVAENIGTATVALNYGTGTLTYNPAEVYPINIALADLQNDAKNGFQIVALDSLDNNAGTWELVEEANTQILGGSTLTDRSYVTHTTAGNTLNTWNMNWIAPTEDVGPITFYLATSTTEALAAQVAIYPNPANNFLTIQSLDLSILQAKLYTATGQLVQQQSFPNQLDVSNYANGLYLLELQTENGVVLKKILVQ